MASVFDRIDLERYSRQIPVIGAKGQLDLASARVAVVGLGGLGSIVAMYLAAMGVGRLLLVDSDRVEVSNLSRQLIYGEDDLGKAKAEAAATRIRSMTSLVDVEAVEERVGYDNVDHVLSGVDVIVDGLDDWRPRLAIDWYAWEKGIPLVHGAANALYGQATTILKGRTNCLACLAPEKLPPPGCRAILGPVLGVVGSIQAMEVVKVVTGKGEPLYNRLLIVDLEATRIDEVRLKPGLDCEECRRRLVEE